MPQARVRRMMVMLLLASPSASRAVAQPAPPARKPAAAPAPATADSFLADINKERARAKLPPMKASEPLAMAAQRRAYVMEKVGPASPPAVDDPKLLQDLAADGFPVEAVTAVLTGAMTPGTVARWARDPKSEVLGSYTHVGVGKITPPGQSPVWYILLARAKGGKAADAGTPEAALRAFFLAMARHDEAALKGLVLPVDDFAYLLKGEAVPADQAEEVRDQIERMPIRALKAGDKITLPNKTVFTIPPQDLGPDRALLQPEGSPVPTRLRKVEGAWKVDVGPVIAGRKAAEAARKKAGGGRG